MRAWVVGGACALGLMGAGCEMETAGMAVGEGGAPSGYEVIRGEWTVPPVSGGTTGSTGGYVGSTTGPYGSSGGYAGSTTGPYAGTTGGYWGATATTGPCGGAGYSCGDVPPPPPPAMVTCLPANDGRHICFDPTRYQPGSPTCHPQGDGLVCSGGDPDVPCDPGFPTLPCSVPMPAPSWCDDFVVPPDYPMPPPTDADAGTPSCECESDGDACTADLCAPDGSCAHLPLAAPDAADADGDGFPEGCDCNDESADVFPGQEAFFEQPPEEQAGFDYDCSGTQTRKLRQRAMPCATVSGGECVGDGWLLADGETIPDCGEAAAFRVCERFESTCVATTTMQLQACR